MQDNVIYTQRDQAGLNRFYSKIYGLVGMGIGLSAFVSLLMLYVFPQNLIAISSGSSWIYYGAVILELALVVMASSAAAKNTPAALPLFLTYSALNGFTL
ncbi:Bax inhibitor-1 family protein, partial [Streptococcus loxodontisalivarius]